MECDRKYMFGDKSTFGSTYNGQIMPKKRSTRCFVLFCTFNKGQLPTF